MPSAACIRKLEPWIDKIELSKLGIEFNVGATKGSTTNPGTIYLLKPDNNVDKKIIEKLESALMEKNMLQKYTKMLESNKNLILTGAPGTGKTYLARQIAQQMLFGGVKTESSFSDDEKKILVEHFAFVQFHPSYDYTDFVEGLRPTPPDDHGQIGFELKNGVFKEFCAHARKDAIIREVDNFDDAWGQLIQTIINAGQVSIPLNATTQTKYSISGSSSLKFVDISAGTLTKNNIYNVYRGLKGRGSGAYQNYMQAVVNYMKKNHGLQNYKQGELSFDETQKPYIFVIDEINRGEISKIFGELFFSIDPGYRGIKGKVSTQYVNLIPEGDVFKDGFYVPENVYIIGTMNDIDRSVESFDFAMRRRFAWVEIIAAESAESMSLLPESRKRMTALNKAISSIEGLSSSYHIGGAYLLKLKNHKDDYDKLWEYHIEPLLREYLRGMPDAEEKLRKLKKAYDLESDGTDNANNG
ncbi:hypothetical protein FACS1894200_09590 [Spirochaetia bacterium]|nr:hypothetical protein FACS1894200_09590 [Spirochaetia bacterium]